jgi:hypothetical protein
MSTDSRYGVKSRAITSSRVALRAGHSRTDDRARDTIRCSKCPAPSWAKRARSLSSEARRSSDPFTRNDAT